jgi:glycosyltransferase involved in cell wall biosynthesis
MTLFIGMPVYNRERFLEESILSIVKQKYLDWRMLISDNNSSDNSLKIIESFHNQYINILYHSQPTNLGLEGNHNYLVSQFLKSECEYFMWAQSDDIYEQTYLEKLMNGLSQSDYKVAFSNMINIDGFGHTIRLYEDLSRFSNTSKIKRLYKFIIEPEVLGKSNIYHSIFHRSVIEKLYSLTAFNYNWSDNVISYFALKQSNIYIEREVLFLKRNAHSDDGVLYTAPKLVKNPFIQTLPLNSYLQFIIEIIKFFMRKLKLLKALSLDRKFLDL